MEWHLTDAQSLAYIDRELSRGAAHSFSPAEYEIVRRVIYATGDFEYLSFLRFSDRALSSGAAALAARSTIVADSPMVQVGLTPVIQATFANPVYCALETLTRPQQGLTQAAWGMQTLAARYPEAIFVIGHAPTALVALVRAIEAGEVQPALVVAAPAGFLGMEEAKTKLQEANIPHITIVGEKGGASVSAAIVEGLAELAWQAYGTAANLAS